MVIGWYGSRLHHPGNTFERTGPMESSLLEPAELQQIIEQGIPDAKVSVTDLTGTRDHYRVDVESAAFAGKSLVQQHQMVYRAVGPHMTQAVHALQIRTSTPEEPES